MKYPEDWYVLKTDYGLSFSTTFNQISPNRRPVVANTPWARATFTFEPKLKTQTLEDWLRILGEHPSPSIESIVQYVKIGDKNFLGSFPFNEIGWKNAYFKLSGEKILKLGLILEVEDENYSKIFYIIIKTLKFVTGH